MTSPKNRTNPQPCLKDACAGGMPNVRKRGALPKTQLQQPLPGRTRHGERGFKG